MSATTTAWMDGTWGATARAPDAPARELSLPSAERGLSYAFCWWAVMLPAWLQRHQLAPRSAARYGAAFTASPALQQRYDALFDLRPDRAATPYPVLQAHCVATLLQARVLADLGINRRHLSHLRHQTRLPLGAAAFAAAGQQRLDCQLQRLVRVSPTEVLALLQTRISDADDRTLALVDDSFVVQGLAPADALRAGEDDGLRRAFSRARRHGPEIDACAAGVRRRQLFIGGDADRRFARVSGDRRRLPLPRLALPLLTRRRPSVQNLYLRNLVVRELAEWGVRQDSLQITFAARARAGQTLCLLLQDSRFELLDEEGRLVAWGHAA